MSISINVDLDDVYYEMSNWDKTQMAEWLYDEGYCTVNEGEWDENEFVIENPTLLDEMWVDTMKKLFHGRLQLSLEDEETIKNIVSKL